ncbi:MAG: hypothetical protein R3E68_18320 [Burkholderiaceae bacterium]
MADEAGPPVSRKRALASITVMEACPADLHEVAVTSMDWRGWGILPYLRAGRLIVGSSSAVAGNPERSRSRLGSLSDINAVAGQIPETA